MRRLLVVDDEADILDFVERVFRRDFVVLRAGGVDEALAVAAAHPIDVVVSDHRMPRRSGLELLEAIARSQPACVRVLLTGYAQLADPPAAADACVTKPVDGETLRQAVAEAIARRSPT